MLSRTMNCVPPGRVGLATACAAAAPLPAPLVPGRVASVPGASADVPELGATNSPTVPFTADTVASTGARSVVSSSARCAWSTAAWAAVTCPACAEMLDGRSEAADASAFCALTTPCWALATASRPLASVTSCCCFAASRLFCAVTTPLLAELTAASALVQADEDGPFEPEVDIVGTLGVLVLVVDPEPLDASIATAGLLARAAFLASSALSS